MEQNADLEGIVEVQKQNMESWRGGGGQKLGDFDIFYTSIQFPFSFALLYFNAAWTRL